MTLSQYSPWLLKLAIAYHRTKRHLEWYLGDCAYSHTIDTEPLASRVKKHQSVLVRRYQGQGVESDDMLQMQLNKIENLKVVIEQLDGILIHPGETFSFCKLVGKPSRKRGFVEGMELSRGAARKGVGGGICQASNLIYWLALHSPLEVVERHHHSFDPFPDSGRVLPFASGATVMYNYRDLRLHNPTQHTFQLKLWLDDKCLNGDLRCTEWLDIAYHIYEKNHFFEQKNKRYYRSNELWRLQKDKHNHGDVLADEFIVKNYAEVKYTPSQQQLIN